VRAGGLRELRVPWPAARRRKPSHDGRRPV